ncbi:MAG: hypothetical protein EP326_07835 [Deltaproteobacteria bacterium]|nr:MAG: hypothetical protein EP326_07835 [Deltaproteobacteria bacterium]
MTLPHLHTGSVKNIKGIKGQSPYVFEFSDRYSVFDWGAMPDNLEQKGACLAAMAQLFFKKMGEQDFWQEWNPEPKLINSNPLALELWNTFKKSGVSHHCLGLVDSQNNPSSEMTNSLAVEPVHVPQVSFDPATGKWDYSEYEKSPVKTLVPLEVIFRFGIPEGSSLMKRVKDPDYLQDIGLTKEPCPGDQFEIPVIEFSTKLESTDRYVRNNEAKLISGMNDVEFQKTKALCLLLALRLKDMFFSIGIKLWDGKFEFAFDQTKDEQGNRNLQLVDSIGPDELRLTYNGIQLSKENLRRFYRNSEWYKKVEEAKGIARDRNEKDWKAICEKELNCAPAPLSQEQKMAASMMYKTLTNALYEKFEGKTLFENTWNLNLLTDKMERL